MKKFLGHSFLLSNQTAEQLYHTYAENLPIIDYHCHIPPADIAGNIKFENITQAWLYADHYKWRAMRACGVEEKYITGDASDEEKFYAYAGCMDSLIGNPLYHWSHLELSRYCGIDTPLNEATASKIWEQANEALKSLSARDIITKSNVEAICTTDDPADTLAFHDAIKSDSLFSTKVLPAFRPDRALSPEKADFTEYLAQLSKSSGVDIQNFNALKKALLIQLEKFANLGCRAADHGMLTVPYVGAGEKSAEEAFSRRLSGKALTQKEENDFKAELLLFLGREYAKRDWVMEIHFGVLRNTNRRKFSALGADSGFDNMGQENNISALTGLLDTLEFENSLPKVLLFPINPGDNAPVCTLCGAFGDKVQPGSAWWFNDTLIGMQNQLDIYASLLPIGKFIGFLTDSRSFLSYTRHEYFRRIVCNWVGQKVENGEFPADENALSKLISGICYKNAKVFLNL